MPKNFAIILIFAIVTLAPLPFGSAEPFWGAIWCALLGLALFAVNPLEIDARLRAPVLLLLVVVAAWCVVVTVQYFPTRSPFSAGSGWKEAGQLLADHPLAPKLAAYSQIPIAAVIPPLALVLALVVGLVFGSEPDFTAKLYYWLGSAGLIYAAYSIFSEVTNPTMLLWREKTAYADTVTGTFVNHNTAATFFGSITIIWYMRALREIRRTIDLSRWGDLKYVSYKLKNLEFFQGGYAVAFFVSLATTFMTRSRAGSLLTLIVLGMVTVLYFGQEIKSGRRVFGGIAALAVAGALAIAAAGGQFAHEIEARGVYDAGRAAAWRSALAIIHDHPWLGTGLGTFASVFPAYRMPAGGVWGVFDHAHSTPLELLVEMGIPFSLLVFSLWIVMLMLMARAALRGYRNRSYVVAGFGIGTLGTLHSLVDFSLQIPGFSIACCALTGAGLAAALIPTEEPQESGQSAPNGDTALSEPPIAAASQAVARPITP